MMYSARADVAAEQRAGLLPSLRQNATDQRPGMTINTKSKPAPPHGVTPLEQPMEALLDSLGLGMIVVDADLTVRLRNAVADALLPQGDDLNTVFADAQYGPSFRDWSAQVKHVLETGEPTQLHCVLPAKNGPAATALSIRCAAYRDSAERAEDGMVVLVEAVPRVEPIDHHVEVSHRLASLGKLATRVAHELNNPLDGILRYVNLAIRVADDTPQPKLKSYLAESRTGLMRMAQIIGDLLQFSRTTEGRFDQATVNDVVEQAIRVNAPAAEANGVMVAADFQTNETPCVYGSRLYQVCCNLIKNAIEAMPEGGRVSITTGMVDSEVVIRVADTGPGLGDLSEKVFEPLFTTKELGRGTGLGLAVCKEFVEDMHGTITASAREEGGAVFTVRIPKGGFHGPSSLIRSNDAV